MEMMMTLRYLLTGTVALFGVPFAFSQNLRYEGLFSDFKVHPDGRMEHRTNFVKDTLWEFDVKGAIGSPNQSIIFRHGKFYLSYDPSGKDPVVRMTETSGPGCQWSLMTQGEKYKGQFGTWGRRFATTPAVGPFKGWGMTYSDEQKAYLLTKDGEKWHFRDSWFEKQTERPMDVYHGLSSTFRVNANGGMAPEKWFSEHTKWNKIASEKGSLLQHGNRYLSYDPAGKDPAVRWTATVGPGCYWKLTRGERFGGKPLERTWGSHVNASPAEGPFAGWGFVYEKEAARFVLTKLGETNLFRECWHTSDPNDGK